MNKKFSIGNIVQLKSGGPEMTVDGYKSIAVINGPSRESDTMVECSWFVTNEKRMTETFHQDTLDFADDVEDSNIGGSMYARV